MKILEQSPRRLCFKQTGVIAAIISIVFVLMGGGALVLAAKGAFDPHSLKMKEGKPLISRPHGAFEDRAIPYLVGGAFVLIGAAIGLFGAGSITCTLDKGAGDLTIDKKAILRSRSDSYRLKEITGAEVQESSSRDSDGRTTMTYRTAFVFADGRRVPIGLAYTSGRAQFDQMAKLVNDFLRH
jgi:hypothetical protein